MGLKFSLGSLKAPLRRCKYYLRGWMLFILFLCARFIKFLILTRKRIKKNHGEPLKALFIVLHSSIWKIDPVFRKMLLDDRFDPIILIAPLIGVGENVSSMEIKRAESFFLKKGYPVASEGLQRLQKVGWINLRKKLKPDLIFFTNPHELTKSRYYSDLYNSCISYFVPYDLQVSQYQDYQPQYNQSFHNSMWRIFSPHSVAKKIHQKISNSKGLNVIETGHPALEPFFIKSSTGARVWKGEGDRLRIIWAPHHSIDMPNLPYANFLKYAHFFRDLAIKYSSKVQWAFKPHPLLRSKLQTHPDWGMNSVSDYWNFWSESSFSQIEEGDYVDLFIQSNAMIHDSGSFLAEYLAVNKPVLYLASAANINNFLNDFGVEAYAACSIAFDGGGIDRFINSVINGEDDMRSSRELFLKKNIFPYYDECVPSDIIFQSIKTDFGLK